MERKEPTLNITATPRPEAAQRRQPEAGAKRPAASSVSRQAATPRNRPAPVYQPKSSGGFMAGLALLVAVSATAGSGYLAWQLERAKAELDTADTRLQALEKRLDFTDEESMQSVGAIRAKLKWADTEIRKLWGVSYDTNRKTIKSNSDQLAKVSKQSKTAHTLAVSYKKKIAQLEKLTRGDSEHLQEALMTLESQNKRLQEAVDKANTANAELANLRSDFGSRVSNNEDAIAAIDAYRVRINRDINDLKQRAGLQ